MTRRRKWAVVVALFVANIPLSTWLGHLLGWPDGMFGGVTGGTISGIGCLWAEGYRPRRTWWLHPWQAWLTYAGLRLRQRDGRMSGRRRDAWRMARAVEYVRLDKRKWLGSNGATVFIDGPCPFLTCFEPGPHRHDVCPQCGAVRYGNLFCSTCTRNRNREDVTT